MKLLKRTFATIIIASFIPVIPTTAIAASKDECAIWLCLPAGFPSGCSAAKSAFKKRIKKRKPPLPAFSSCAVSSPGISYIQQSAAFIPAHKECPGGSPDDYFCNATFVPDQYINGIYCTGETYFLDSLNGCIDKGSITVLDNKKTVGSTFYY